MWRRKFGRAFGAKLQERVQTFSLGWTMGAIGCVHDILECEAIILVGGQGPMGLVSVT